MKIGRNDPCPCGSGRKYKRCCLEREQADELLWHRQRRLNETLPHELLAFTQDQLGELAVVEAWEQFWLWDESAPPMEPGEPELQAFIPWFQYDWRPDPNDTDLDLGAPAAQGIAAGYLREHGSDIEKFTREYLEAALATTFSFHEVVATRPGHSLQLHDLLTGTEQAVTEREASQYVQAGDILFARIVRLGSLAVIDGCSPTVIPPIEKAPILDLRNFMRRQPLDTDLDRLRECRFELLDTYHEITERLHQPAMPELTNTDGDPFRFHTLTFEIDSPRTAFDALKDLALDTGEDELLQDADLDEQGALARVEFPWLQRGNKQHGHWDNTVQGHITIDGDRLTAEVNSETRAEAFRELVEQRLGDAARHRGTTVQSPTAALDDVDPDVEAAAAQSQAELLEDPAVRQAVGDMLEKHYASWPDERMPALDNRTPREAVEDADGREMVEALLAQIERDMHRDHPWLIERILPRMRADLGL